LYIPNLNSSLSIRAHASSQSLAEIQPRMTPRLWIGNEGLLFSEPLRKIGGLQA
jgi:hypothetical protein